MYRSITNNISDDSSKSTTVKGNLSTSNDALLTRSILVAQHDNKTFTNISSTNEGHIEIAIHDPLLPFGSLHTENLIPIFQEDAVYGIFGDANKTFTSLSGTVTASNALFNTSTGITANATTSLQSRKRLRYRPGQGIVCRFTGLFTAPVDNSYQIIGMGHGGDGIYFGYKNTSFGILHVYGGSQEIHTLTITVASSTTQNVTVTLNGVAFSIAVTNSANIQRTVYELSRGTYTGWQVVPVGATLVFVANSAGAKSGAYSISGTTVVGNFVQTSAGAAPTETFVEQKDWNGDMLDGTGSSGINIDWTKGNVFQIGMQYLGFGFIIFKVEVAPDNSNNPTWVIAHALKFPNTRVLPIFRNPSFPFHMDTHSTGSTTNLTVKSASYSGFIEGAKQMHGNRYTFNVNRATVPTTVLPLFTIYNSLVFGGIANQSVTYILNISAAIKHTQPVVVYMIKNPALTGNPNFAQYSPESCTYLDTSATGVTFSNNQLIWSGHLSTDGNFMFDFRSALEEIDVQPGEYITVAAVSLSASAAFVNVSINTREDQ